MLDSFAAPWPRTTTPRCATARDPVRPRSIGTWPRCVTAMDRPNVASRAFCVLCRGGSSRVLLDVPRAFAASSDTKPSRHRITAKHILLSGRASSRVLPISTAGRPLPRQMAGSWLLPTESRRASLCAWRSLAAPPLFRPPPQDRPCHAQPHPPSLVELGPNLAHPGESCQLLAALGASVGQRSDPWSKAWAGEAGPKPSDVGGPVGTGAGGNDARHASQKATYPRRTGELRSCSKFAWERLRSCSRIPRFGRNSGPNISSAQLGQMWPNVSTVAWNRPKIGPESTILGPIRLVLGRIRPMSTKHCHESAKVAPESAELGPHLDRHRPTSAGKFAPESAKMGAEPTNSGPESAEIALRSAKLGQCWPGIDNFVRNWRNKNKVLSKVGHVRSKLTKHGELWQKLALNWPTSTTPPTVVDFGQNSAKVGPIRCVPRFVRPVFCAICCFGPSSPRDDSNRSDGRGEGHLECCMAGCIHDTCPLMQSGLHVARVASTLVDIAPTREVWSKPAGLGSGLPEVGQGPRPSSARARRV